METTPLRPSNSWPLLLGLLALCLVPAAGGLFRLSELSTTTTITAENARFFAAPLPVVTHIVASLMYAVGAAFQFSYKSDRHALIGRICFACGLAASLSGLWMTLFYPRATQNYDSDALYFIRLVVGVATIFALCRGVFAAYRRDFGSHRNWMIRAYALGLGAGTQVFTHIPWFVFPELQGELLRTLCMGGGLGHQCDCGGVDHLEGVARPFARTS